MKWDNYNLIQMEQNPPGDPGNLGDSFAETFRVMALVSLTDRDNPVTVQAFRDRYRQVRTAKGLVRHPDSPWREDDFSGDQFLPGYIAADLYCCRPEQIDMEAILFLNEWKTGNGNLAPLSFWAAKARANGKPSATRDLTLLLQAWGMKYLPFRWNDEKRWFESTKNSSADYLNWIISILHAKVRGHTWASKRALKVFTKDELCFRVLHYYSNEPNSGWAVRLWQDTIYEVF
jgi:hypothetical protein